MAIDQSTRLKIEAELRLGKKAKELSEKYSLPYVTIRGWAKKLETTQANDDITILVETDEALLHKMAEEMKKSSPGVIVPMPEQRKVDKLVENVIGLQKLEEKSRTVAFSILGSVETYLTEKELQDGKMSLKDLRDAAGIVATLHTAIFSKNVTQVNVLNNNTVSEEKRSIFKSSLGA